MFVFLSSLGLLFQVGLLTAKADVLDTWVASTARSSTELLLQNISPSDGARGSVIASPSRQRPNYYYHWVRDAALTIDAVVSLYETAKSPTEQASYFQIISDFARFSRQNQLTPNRSINGFGEPKFYVDGSAYDDDWGRPQNDGPAIRAIALTRFARLILAQGKRDFVDSNLYRAELPAMRVLKADLEFVSHHWQEASFDPWEESLGQHFYVRAVQRRALINGAELADLLDDPGAASWYRLQAQEIEKTLAWHWNDSRNYFLCTIDRIAGIDYKGSGLDSSVVLGVLHGQVSGRAYSVLDDRVIATVGRIQSEFNSIYTLNQNSKGGLAPAIGRYPEDRYDGTSTGATGNPWTLTTLAFAEYYYTLAKEMKVAGRVELTAHNLPFFRALGALSVSQLQWPRTMSSKDPEFWILVSEAIEQGDRFMLRVKEHIFDSGSMSEQINRHSGYMQGAHDLTWNYAAFLTAAAARSHVNR